MKTIMFGAEGYEVIRLQELLDMKQTGHFDADVHDAVVAFQKKCGLVVDGIVGSVTWASLKANVDTDLQEVNIYSKYHMSAGRYILNEVKKKVWLPNFYAGPTEKNWFFGHHTAGGPSPYQTINIWEKDDKTVGTEFVIGGDNMAGNKEFDGVILQAFTDGGYAWHLTIGNNDVHCKSIGVEICNYGMLTEKSGKLFTYTGKEVPAAAVCDVGFSFRGSRYFHAYTEAQIEAMKSLMTYSANKYDIDMSKGLPALIHQKGVQAAFEMCNYDYVKANPGFWAHGNLYAYKNDISPQPAMIEMLLSF